MARQGITGIHQAMMQLHQSMILDRKNKVKTCLIKYPKDTRNKKYQNKQFLVQCTTSSLKADQMKKLDATFGADSIAITIVFEDLENTLSQGSNPIPARLEGFKEDNCEVRYNGKRYTVKMEVVGEYDNSITLYCNKNK